MEHPGLIEIVRECDRRDCHRSDAVGAQDRGTHRREILVVAADIHGEAIAPGLFDLRPVLLERRRFCQRNSLNISRRRSFGRPRWAAKQRPSAPISDGSRCPTLICTRIGVGDSARSTSSARLGDTSCHSITVTEYRSAIYSSRG